MARDFDGTTQRLLSSDTFPTAAAPLTMAYWGYCTSASHASVGMSLGRITASSDASFVVGMRGDVAGDPVRVLHFGNPHSSIFPFADSTTGYSINTWHHACGVFTSDSSRSAYIDGGSKATNTTTRSGADNSNAVAIGVQITNSGGSVAYTRYFLGRIAYPCVWNIALTDAEVLSLARGTHPSLVRPESIVALWELTGGSSPEPDRFGGYNLTLTAAPTVVDNPRILLPSRNRSFINLAPPPAGNRSDLMLLGVG